MSQQLNEHWTRFLDGELPAAEQQWLLDAITRGERLPHDPLSDAETHGVLSVMSQVTREDDDEFVSAVMRRLETTDSSVRDTRPLSITGTSASLAGDSRQRPSTDPPAPAPPAHAADVAPVAEPNAQVLMGGSTRRRRADRAMMAVAAVAAGLAAVVVSVLRIALPDRNSAQRPSGPSHQSVDKIGRKPPVTTKQNDSPSTSLTPSDDAEPRGPAKVDDAEPSLKVPATDLPPQQFAQQGPEPAAPPRPEVPRKEPGKEPGKVPALYPQPEPVWSIKDVHSQLVKWASPLPRDIEGRTLRLLEGSAQLVLSDVGEMTIHAPVESRPGDSGLFVKYGRVMARTQAPMTLETPSTDVEIISRANVVADEDGTAVTAIGPVGILSDEVETGAMAVLPGQFKWVAKTGHVYDWMIGMLEAEGVMTLVVNGELLRLNSVSAANPAAGIQEYLTVQMRSRPDPGDYRGMLLINRKTYPYDGARGIASAGRRLTSQLQQRRKAAVAAGLRLNINGVDVTQGPQMPNGGGVGVAPALTPNTTTARSAADELLDRQQRMIQSMKQAFGVDLSGAEQAVEQARQRIRQTLPPK